MIFLVLILGLCFAWFIENHVRPPRGMRSIPNFPIIACLWALVTKKEIVAFYQDQMRDVLNKHGIGKFWAFGIWIVVVGDCEEGKTILKNNRSYPKSLLSELFPESLATKFFCSNIVFSNGEDWKRYRRIVSPALHRSWSVEPMGKIVLELVAQWDKIGNKPLNITNWNRKMTLDILGKVLFKYDFEAVSNPKSQSVQNYIGLINTLFNPLTIFCPFLDRFRPGMTNSFQQFDKLLTDVIDERRKTLEAKKYDLGCDVSHEDVLTMMIKACYDEEFAHPNKKFSSDDLLNNFRILFFAGHDTTSTSLTSAFYHLAKYPKIQEKVRSEVMEVLGPIDDEQIPTIEQLEKMKYLLMFIQENLRLLPPLGTAPNRRVAEPTSIMGYPVEVNTLIMVQIYHIQRNARYYPNPEQFDLERFHPDKDIKSFPYMPFSAGPHRCLGKALSLLEQKLILAMILARYTVSFPKGTAIKPMQFSGAVVLTPYDIDLCFERIKK